MTGLWLPLAEVAAVLLAAGAAGYGLAAFFVGASCRRDERAAWGFALGLSMLAVSVPAGFLFHISPRWMAVFLAAAGAALSLVRRAGNRERNLAARRPNPDSEGLDAKSALLLALIGLGIGVYTLRTLTEPMWSNDFVAIWGFKGKTIFASGSVPRRLFEDSTIGYSHPEYPLGVPFLYAAVSFLIGRWDDHAMALLFPAIQVATLLSLHGWLRRRAASRTLALAAAAVLAQFVPLYSGFLAGMADVPYSLAVLLFGAAFADAQGETDPLADRRLALASLLAVSTKNEGMLLAAAGVVMWLLVRRRRRASWRVLAAVAAPAVLLEVGGRIWKGNLPLRDYELAYLGPNLIPELLPRLAEALHAGFREVLFPAWPGLLCLAALIAAGRPEPAGDRLLGLAGLCALFYLLVPSLAVLGPDWLIRTSFARTLSALAPVTAAAVAVRLRSSVHSAGAATAGGAGPRGSAARP